MDTTWHLEELLFRGRPAGSELPVTYQVTIQERANLADGRSLLVSEVICTPDEAIARDFPPEAIRAWIDESLSAELSAARSSIAAVTADRDAQVAALETIQREKAEMTKTLEEMQAQALAVREARKAAAAEASAAQ